MSHAYCPECGFQNPEAANYCARCGAYLRRDELGETTLSLTPEELEEGLPPSELRGPALVVGARGGRAGGGVERGRHPPRRGRAPHGHRGRHQVGVVEHRQGLQAGEAGQRHPTIMWHSP